MATTKSKKKSKIKPEFGLFKSEFGHLEYGIVTSQMGEDKPSSEFTAYTLQAVFQGITAELRQRGFKI